MQAIRVVTVSAEKKYAIVRLEDDSHIVLETFCYNNFDTAICPTFKTKWRPCSQRTSLEGAEENLAGLVKKYKA